MASAVWLHGYEDGVDLCQHFGIIQLQNPTFLGSIVFVENTQAERLFPIRSTPAPYLKRASILDLRLVKVVGVEDQRLPFCIEHAAIGLLGPGAGHIVDFRYVEVSRSHKFPNVTVLGQEFVLLVKRSIPVMKSLDQILDLSRQLPRSCLVFRGML